MRIKLLELESRIRAGDEVDVNDPNYDPDEIRRIIETVKAGGTTLYQGAATHPIVDFLDSQKDVTIDSVYDGAAQNTHRLHSVLSEIEEAVQGSEALLLPPKERSTAEGKIERKGKSGVGSLTDVVRSGIVLQTSTGSGEVVRRLADAFGEDNIYDEGWGVKPGLWLDRKVLVRFSDGTVGEAQIRLKSMHDAKIFRGETLYEQARNLPKDNPLRAELIAEMEILYGSAILQSGTEMVGMVLRSAWGNNLRNLASDTAVAFSLTSILSTEVQDLLSNMANASSLSNITAGSPSQSQNHFTDMLFAQTFNCN